MPIAEDSAGGSPVPIPTNLTTNLTGEATGSGTLDYTTGDIDIAVTVVDNGHNHILENITDVQVNNAISGQILVYNGTVWANATNTSGITAIVQDTSPQLGGNLDLNNRNITGTGNIAITGTIDGRDVSADGTKLDGIESGATADQTAAQIKTAYESNANTNNFADADVSKLSGIEPGATADQTAAQIKTAYESNADTNAFTDADHTKLDGIETAADVTDTTNVVASLTAGTNVTISAGGVISSTASGGLAHVVDDTTPQLGGNLDLNSNDITGTGNLNFTGSVTLSGTVDGRDVAADGTKLDGIEASADVTDTANVTAAGALMDSEVTNLAQVKAFDSSDYATAAQGTTADAALPKAGGTMTGDILFNDSVKAKYGTSSDLQIYHDGSNSYISDTGTGDVIVKGQYIRLQDEVGTNLLTADGNDAVSLYFGGASKLSTTTSGIDVSGGIDVANGTTYTTTGDFLAKVQQNSNASGKNGLSVMNAWASNTSTIFEAAMGWNGSVAGYYPVFTIDGLGKTTWKDNFGNVRATIDGSGLDVTGSTITTGTSGTTQWQAGSSANKLTIASYDNNIFYHKLSSGNSTSYQVGVEDNIPIYTITNNSIKTTLLANGNFGVGITAPTQKLEVAGKIQVTSTDPEIFLTDTTTGVDHSIDGNSGVGNLFIHVDKNNEGSDPKFIVNVGSTDELIVATETGYVGIGAPTPDNRLHIFDNNSDISMDSSASGQLHIDGNGYGFAIALDADAANIYTNTASRDLVFGVNETEVARVSTAGLDVTGKIKMFDTGGTQLRIGYNSTYFWDIGREASNGRLSFFETSNGVASGEHMTILTSGNVGVGLSAPTAKMHLFTDGVDQSMFSAQADLGVQNRILTLKSPVSDSSSQPFRWQTSNSILWEIDTTETKSMLLNSAGNLGVGTLSPSYKIDVRGAANSDVAIQVKASGTGDVDADLRLDAADTGESIVRHMRDGVTRAISEYSNSNEWNFTTYNNDKIDFQPNSTNAFRITDNNVYSYKTLNVTGDLTVSSTIEVGSLTPAQDGAIEVGVLAFGTPAIASTTDSTLLRSHIIFDNPNGVVGKINTIGSGTSYVTSSDYRLKTDVQEMTGSIDRVKALRPVNFEWVVDGTRVDGFLAHEAQEVVPEAVDGEKDAMRDQEYVESEATGDIYTPAVKATYETIQVELTPAVEAVYETVTVEISPAVEATYDEEGNELTPAVEAVTEEQEQLVTPAVDATYEAQQQELTPAIDEVIHSTDVVEPDTLEEGQLWRETTEKVMATRQVPDYQGIDQSKIVPLLTSALQDAIAKIEALETRLEALES